MTKKTKGKTKAAPKAAKKAKATTKAAPKLTDKQLAALKRVQAEPGLPITAYDKRTVNALGARKLVKASPKAVTLSDAGAKFLGAAV